MSLSLRSTALLRPPQTPPKFQVEKVTALIYVYLMDSFEHCDLGPLPIDPRILKMKREIDKLKEECSAWERKYRQIFDEQMKTNSIETQLRERIRSCESEREKLKSKAEALMEIAKELLQRPLE